MAEFRKIIDVPPTTWTKDSLYELSNIVLGGVNSNQNYDKFSLANGDAEYSSSSIEGAFDELGEKEVSSIKISVLGWENNQIINSVDISMAPTVSQLQFFSINENWFLGRIEQFNNLFQRQRPWYSFLNLKFPLIAGFVQGISFVGAIVLLGLQSWLFAFALFAINLIIAKAFKLFQRGKLFPKTKFQVNQPSKAISAELLTLLLTVIATVATVLGVVFQVVSFVNQ
jgi:hypothetical protein